MMTLVDQVYIELGYDCSLEIHLSLQVFFYYNLLQITTKQNKPMTITHAHYNWYYYQEHKTTQFLIFILFKE